MAVLAPFQLANVAASFTPASLYGLSLWLSADTGVTLDGSNVTSWEDQSGNGNTAISSYDPIFLPSYINNKPAIDFLTNAGFFNLTSNIDPIKSIFVLFKTGPSVTQYKCIVEANFGMYSGISDSLFGTYLNNEIGYTSLSTNTAYILSIESNDGVSSNGYINGQQYLDENGEGFSTRGYVQIGAGQSGGQPSGGYLSEVIIYDRVLTNAERQQIQSYLNTKYAIY
jgi:hypothetical protein